MMEQELTLVKSDVQNNNGSWSQLGDDIEGEAARDKRCTKRISLSDDGLTLAVGSPMNDDTGSNQGKVRVYEYKGVHGLK